MSDKLSIDELEERAKKAIEAADRAIDHKLQLVKVKYFTSDGEAVSDREYTYYTFDILQIGDIVIVPVRDTTGKAKVSSVNVSESEIEKFKDKVKTIPAGSKVAVQPERPVGLPEGGLAEAAFLAGAEVKVVDLSPEVRQGIVEAIEQKPADNAPVPQMTALMLQSDTQVANMLKEVSSAVKYAEKRIITGAEDVKLATADLALIAKLTKAIEEKRQEYVSPLNIKLKEINSFFKQFEPIGQANAITRRKILEYNAEVDRKIAEAKRIDDEKYRLAQEEAKLKGGEITVDLTPVEKPEETPASVRTGLGDAHKTGTWKHRVVDFKLLPDEYKMPDDKVLSAIARTHHDKKQIPGIEFYFEPGLRVNTR